MDRLRWSSATDSHTKEGHGPGITYPRVPGHEIAGVIDAVGPDVPQWKVGQRVGIGWLGFYCGYCESCRRGSFVTCANQKITGITRDGGYQDYVLVPFEGLALIPNEISPVEGGPPMCAGITTFNSLRNSGARDGETIAVLGIGGLGHLGVQFAAKMGFRTIAIAGGKDKELLAKQLGRAALHRQPLRQIGRRSCRSWAVRELFSRRRRTREQWPRP